MFSAGGAAIQAKPQIIENQKCDRHTHKHTTHTHTDANVLRLHVLALNFVRCAGALDGRTLPECCTLPFPSFSYLPLLLIHRHRLRLDRLLINLPKSKAFDSR